MNFISQCLIEAFAGTPRSPPWWLTCDPDITETAASACRRAKQALSLLVEEDPDNFRARTASEILMKLLERCANHFSARRLRVAGFTKKMDRGVDPFGIRQVETNGDDLVPADESRAW